MEIEVCGVAVEMKMVMAMVTRTGDQVMVIR